MTRSSVARLIVAVAIALPSVLYLSSDEVAAERSGRAGVEVSLDGSISPRYIPRHRRVPVSLDLSGTVRTDEALQPSALERIEIAFGARGGLETAGLPVCPRRRLRNATPREALTRCRGALIGHGELTAEVALNPDRPLLARAALLAFNGISRGRPTVWAHAYSASPPISFVLPFYVQRPRASAYGILLRSPVRHALGPWPRLRDFQITLGRRYRAHGELRSYLSASCPLPPRFSIGLFPFAQATYYFTPRPTLTTTILRGCRVKR
jgi:hypothetical protein